MEHGSSASGVMAILNRIHNACSPDKAVSPPLARPNGAPVVGAADSRTRRYYLIREAKYKDIAEARTDAERHVAQALYDIAERMFALQVWLQYPVLTGRSVAIYCDWSVGPEDYAQTTDLFRAGESAPGKEGNVFSTRNVSLGLLLHPAS